MSSTQPPASRVWISESNQNFDEEVSPQRRFADPETGVQVVRLTSRPCISENIYPEAPVSTPDGRYFIFARSDSTYTYQTFWIADIVTRRIRQITDEPDAAAPVVSPDGSSFYYSAGRTIVRIRPGTFEREPCFRMPDELGPVGAVRSVSYCGTRVLAPARRARGGGVVVVDLARGTADLIFEHPNALNPHPQYSHNQGCKICVQVNDGIELDGEGNITRLVGPLGASLHVLNEDGSGLARLNLGGTALERPQGHECWVGTEDRVIATLHRRSSPDAPWVQDRIVTIAPGEPAYRVVGSGEAFCHIHTSPDGRWWVSDCNQTARIFVGSLATGRYRLFCSSRATFGAAQYTHPHPFFLGDGRTIGWNSDVTGVPQIYVASIPEGFLGELEA